MISFQLKFLCSTYFCAYFSSGIFAVEYPGAYLPEGHDNINPLILKETFLRSLPKYGCNNKTSLLIGVLSRPSEFDTRTWIRNTWGHSRQLNDSTSLIFIVGNSEDEYINNRVSREYLDYQDILKLDMQEHYRNLSLKVYALLEYGNQYCSNVKCVQKTDSDAIVNVGGLELLCSTLHDHEHVITGMVYINIKINRDTSQKLYVPRYVYPNDMAPDHATGAAYLLSGYQILPKMLATLKEKTQFFNSENYRRFMEDVIFTGDVRVAASGIRIQDISGYMCGQDEMNFWCDASTNYTKIPITFENNHKIPLSEDWERMKSWITFKDDCQPMTIGKFILNLIAKIFGDEFNGKCVTHDG